MVYMGPFKDLFGKGDSAKAAPAPRKPRSSPGYDRIDMWIESRIGKVDPNDPMAGTKYESLLREEGRRYPSARGRVIISHRGNDTIISGDTMPFKGPLRRLGCKWDPRSKSWVAKGKDVREEDIDGRSGLAGLREYIFKVRYGRSP
jgi:hypothetical protein